MLAMLLLLPYLQSIAGQPYGSLPVHMYAVQSTNASAMTAHVAAAAAAQQQLGRAGGSSTQGQQGSSSSSRQEIRPAFKGDDFVEVEKSNMVMLVSGGGWVQQEACRRLHSIAHGGMLRIQAFSHLGLMRQGVLSLDSEGFDKLGASGQCWVAVGVR
jgi:hypothetical protein